LLLIHAGEYQEFLDTLVELMVKELNLRMAGDGSDNETSPIIRHEIDGEIRLIKHTSQTYVLSAYNKVSLLRILPIVAGMKGKLDKELKQLKGSGIFEVVTELLFFFGLDYMLKYDVAIGYFLLVLDSDPEELQPLLEEWITRLTNEEKEWAAESMFMYYINEILVITKLNLWNIALKAYGRKYLQGTKKD
jgi:hypothetical protein